MKQKKVKIVLLTVRVSVCNECEKNPGVTWKNNSRDFPAVHWVLTRWGDSVHEGTRVCQEKKSTTSVSSSVCGTNLSKPLTCIPTRARPSVERVCWGVATYPTWECMLEKFLYNTGSPTEPGSKKEISLSSA